MRFASDHCRRADPGRVDDPVDRRRERNELEPRQQRDRGEAEGDDRGACEDRETAPAQLQDEQEQRGGGGDGGELLRPAQDREGQRARQDQRRGAPSLTADGELRRGDARREPRGARQQPERLRARQQVARHAEGEPGVDRAQPAGADQAGEGVRRERREQVVERDEHDHPGRGREQPVGQERRRVEHARLRVGGERLAREREGIPEREVAVSEAVVQEGRERGVERVRVVGIRDGVPQRERREHQDGDERDRPERRQLAGARPGRDAHTGERNLHGRVPTCEFRRWAHPRPRVDDYAVCSLSTESNASPRAR